MVRSLQFSITLDVLRRAFRMTKFPPGFSSEIREHLSNNPPIDDVTNTPIVDLENYCCGELLVLRDVNSALNA